MNAVTPLEPPRVARAFVVALLVAVVLGPAGASAGLRPPPPQDRVQAPRFELSDPEARLPLSATRHRVEVVGPVAQVEVTQVYVNTGQTLLDATYVFPGSARSAVASLVMRIGDRTVRAELQEREKARATFEAAKQEGFRASLLEQDRPNVFRMALTNVRPGETVEVTLGYTELIEPEGGAYELVLPAVVAPRFGGEAEGLGERESLGAGDPSPAWTADVRLADGLGITEVSSPTHEVSPRVDDDGRVQVEISTRGDAEFVLRWRLAAGLRPDAGVVLYPGRDESFFMMTVAPPKQVEKAAIPPREIAFVLDVSGSMRGYPLEVARTVMAETLRGLRASDRFNVLFFAGSGWSLSSAPLPATQENVERALRAVSEQRGGGGTQLVSALAQVARLPRAQGLARTVVVVTDGLVGFEKRAFAELRAELQRTTVFTLGIGHNVNRMLVEGLARAGGGASFVAHDREGARREARRLGRAMGAPVLTDLALDIEGLDAYELEPPVLPDLYADRPVVVVGKYRGEPKGTLRFSAHASDRSLVRTLEVTPASASASHAPLRVLWARRRLQRVADDRTLVDGGADSQTITDLGLKYGLLTEHTAFVAVDTAGGQERGAKRSLVQPAPHPKGMAPSGPRTAAFRLGAPAAPATFAPSQGAVSNVFGPASASGGLGRAVGSGGGGRDRSRRPAPALDAPRAAEAEPRLREANKAEEDAPAPRLRILPAIVVKGALTRDAIEPILRRHRGRLEAAMVDLAPGTRATVELVIDAGGEVASATVLEGPLAQARSAVLRVLKRLRFLATGTPSIVRIPLVLE